MLVMVILAHGFAMLQVILSFLANSLHIYVIDYIWLYLFSF